MKKLIASVTIVASTLGAGAGAAFAAAGDQGDTAAAQPGHGRRHRVLAQTLQVAAETIGVSTDELKQAVKDGQTVAQVAQSKGVDPQQVVDAVVAAATQKIDDAVKAGKIDADRAATLKAKLPDGASRMVNETGQRARQGQRGERTERRQQRRQAVLDTAAQALGMSADELRSALKSGTSIADVATERDVDLSTVTTALVDAATQKIDDAVQAGKIDAEKATQIKAKLADRVDKLVHRTFGGGRAA